MLRSRPGAATAKGPKARSDRPHGLQDWVKCRCHLNRPRSIETLQLDARTQKAREGCGVGAVPNFNSRREVEVRQRLLGLSYDVGGTGCGGCLPDFTDVTGLCIHSAI